MKCPQTMSLTLLVEDCWDNTWIRQVYHVSVIAHCEGNGTAVTHEVPPNIPGEPDPLLGRQRPVGDHQVVGVPNRQLCLQRLHPRCLRLHARPPARGLLS